MEIKQIKVTELKPYKNNPRKNEQAVDAVAASIKEFGFKVPIIIDKDYEIVAGHTRLKAAVKLGLAEVPCIIADDLTDDQIKAFRIADNSSSQVSEWDYSLLEQELASIDFDMTMFGLDEQIKEIEKLNEKEAVEDEVPEVSSGEPITQLGDIWQLGRHRLMCGDSTNPETVKKLMDGKLADLLLTDPPYNVAYEGTAGTIKNDDMEDKKFKEFLLSAFINAKNSIKPGASFYIWHADSEGYNFRSACRESGFTVRQCLIWKKSSLVMGRQDYQWQHEPCLYGWKDGDSHYWGSDRKQTTILEFDKPTKNALHPTMKPVGLFDYLIKNSSQKTTLFLIYSSVAALQLLRASKMGEFHMEWSLTRNIAM